MIGEWVSAFGLRVGALLQRHRDPGTLPRVVDLRRAPLAVVVGVAIGLAGTFGAAHLVESMLCGLEPQDPATLAAAVLIIAFVAVLAAYIPARRGARVNPTVALRCE